VLGGYAGLRAFDIAALDGDDLITSGPVPLLRVRGKGGDEKFVAVGELVVKVLSLFIGRRGPMFRNAAGRRYQAPTIDKRINAFMERIGLLERFHNLRHRYCTKTYEITQDIRYTQLQARHASVATTQIYTLVSQDRRPDALADLDQILAARVVSRERRRA
jgi:site-specific recombinase XerC